MLWILNERRIRISALCRSVFRAFRIIILFHNERLLIAFLVHLFYHMFLPRYCAIHLKEMSFNFTVYIFIYNYITCFSWILQQYKEQCISFYIIILDLVLHLFAFICSTLNNVFFFPMNFRFYKIIVIYRVTFATELSTNLDYNSIFVIDYNYICINLLFFFTIKLSIFSRLCVKKK